MKKKVLIIEDEKNLIDVLKKKINKEDCEVSVARNKEEGLRMIKKINPDLILLDITMPKIDGFVIMETMTKDEKMKNIPIIAISNSGQSTELNRAQKLGVKDLIVRTELDLQDVMEKVKKHINSY